MFAEQKKGCNGTPIHYVLRIADTLLVANEDWVYGRFEDYFELPPLDCKPDPEAYDHRSPTVTLVGKPGWQNATRLSMRRG